MLELIGLIAIGFLAFKFLPGMLMFLVKLLAAGILVLLALAVWQEVFLNGVYIL